MLIIREVYPDGYFKEYKMSKIVYWIASRYIYNHIKLFGRSVSFVNVIKRMPQFITKRIKIKSGVEKPKLEGREILTVWLDDNI